MVAVVALVAVVGVVVWLLPTDKQRVEKQFKRLAALIEKKTEEKPITLAQKSVRVSRLFAQTSTFTTEVEMLLGTYKRGDIPNLVAQYRMCFATLSLEFSEMVIECPVSGRARVTLMARLVGQFARGSGIDERRELECELSKIDGDWLFVSCVTRMPAATADAEQ